MRAALLALMLTVATQAGAECGNLCDYNWWKTATAADVQTELDGGADVMARYQYGSTPLHKAAGHGSAEVRISVIPYVTYNAYMTVIYMAIY